MSDFVTVALPSASVTFGTLERLLTTYAEYISNPDITDLIKDEANLKLTFSYNHTDNY